MSYDNLFWGDTDTLNHSQWKIKAESLLADRDIFTPHANKAFPLGAIAETRDGRKFRYCKNDSTQIAKNLLVQGAASGTAAFVDELQTGYTITAGDKTFDLLITTANGFSDGDLIDGYLLVNQGTAATDEGDLYIIKNNKWTTSDTVINIEISDAGGARNAMAATSNVTFIKNLYRDVIVKPTALTGVVIGATTTIVSASYYFWAQTTGPASVIVDAGDTIVVGEPVGHPGTSGTAGSVGLVANDGTDPVYGTAIYAAAAADYALVNLTIG